MLSLEKNIILSVGGGAPCYGENMKLINDTATALYLKASIKTLVDRLNKEKKNRPLVANLSLEKMSEFIGKHLFERAYFYEQAKFIVKIDDRTIEEIVEEIKTKLV
ncbi:MAG: shikimate kinase [Urechidicola sp.]